MQSKLPYSKVMVVDDNKMDNLLVGMVLKTINYALEIISFQNPKEALHYLKGFEEQTDNLPPDVIFLDINMPLMNGFEFLDELKKFNHNMNNYKIYMLSSSDETEDIEKARSYPNVIKYLKKPLDREELLNIK
jgi:response regulator RpfG family c-di-GMP phosphodiesterase